ncbi:hypothetical protein LSG31_11065 [Fodinisporobacter ferrooxydans]|uniref:Uncharacterized protein n=1 Tax=Fodinisporobacter ferrooxydans TaxID=2901836 RepID=A0ABY4CTR4_9BACL|nr:hypothetical protein LSG31_11065 [Alicyclobacillaceae bacterium MYW30-H2]
MEKCQRIEVFLWSIALPGFGQLLNGKFFKGIVLIGLELLVNNQSNLNEIIISSFHGEIEKTIHQTNYQWLMFYPCIYIFGIWDAYKDASVVIEPYAVLPFAFGAFSGTVGIIFSRDFLGPVWLGMIGLFFGVVIGLLLKNTIEKRNIKRRSDDA